MCLTPAQRMRMVLSRKPGKNDLKTFARTFMYLYILCRETKESETMFLPSLQSVPPLLLFISLSWGFWDTTSFFLSSFSAFRFTILYMHCLDLGFPSNYYSLLPLLQNNMKIPQTHYVNFCPHQSCVEYFEPSRWFWVCSLMIPWWGRWTLLSRACWLSQALQTLPLSSFETPLLLGFYGFFTVSHISDTSFTKLASFYWKFCSFCRFP